MNNNTQPKEIITIPFPIVDYTLHGNVPIRSTFVQRNDGEQFTTHAMYFINSDELTPENAQILSSMALKEYFSVEQDFYIQTGLPHTNYAFPFNIFMLWFTKETINELGNPLTIYILMPTQLNTNRQIKIDRWQPIDQ